MRQKGLCANCFGKGHFAKDCRKPWYVMLMAVEESTANFCTFLMEKAMKVPEAPVYRNQPMHLEVRQPHDKKPAVRRQVILRIVVVAKLLCQLYL